MTDRPDNRLEDARMLTGQGRYLADAIPKGALFAGFVRADLASAKIARLDTGAAAAMPGIRAVLTAADLARDGIAPLPHDPLPRDDGGAPGNHPVPILCADRVRHLGEPLALVVAETQGALPGAIEAVGVDLAEAPAIAGLAFARRFGDEAATRAALDRASHRHRIGIEVPRCTALALEPRGAIATPDGQGGLSYRASTQNPFAIRDQMAAHFGWDPAALHVTAGDVGGSFGLKGHMTREDAALAWAARRLGATIAWLPGRSETILADAQGRGVAGEVEIGLSADLDILAVAGRFTVDCGAYPGRRAFGLMNNINGLTGMYRVAHAFALVEGRLSARAPLAPFRGNGRPEATQAIERALDAVARRIGADPVALRLRNLIRPDEMPATTALGTRIDCGDFPRVMLAALDANPGAERRRAAAGARGRLYGIGLANCIESAGGPVRNPRPDCARISVFGDGRIALAPGVMSVGQGHETALTRLAAERLEIDPGRIAYRQGDTRAVGFGRGSGGSAGLTVAGSAVWTALGRVIDEGGAAAAAELGCGAADVAYRDGAFHAGGTNRSISLAALAEARFGGRWQVEAEFAPQAATFPNGTHVCEVEIDPETGALAVARYVAVEDVGRVLHPALVEGQLQGGIAQGLSLGLGERMVFDEAGQILTGTLMDYALVRAGDLPALGIGSVEVPTALNPLGVKGVGEAGAVGATAALASAVSDALWRAGVEAFELPATPARIWQALNAARRR